MIKGFFTLLGGFDQDFQIFFNLALPYEIIQHLGSQGIIQPIARLGFGVNDSLL